MSLTENIKNAISIKLVSLIPEYKPSQHNWDTTQNSESRDKSFFAIRPGSASFVSGTLGTMTMEQGFDIELGMSYKSKGDRDLDMDEKIYSMYEAHEILYKSLLRDNLGIPRVQVVSDVDIGEVAIDTVSKVVRITASFTIKYRTE